MRWPDCRARACVFDPRPIRLHLRSEGQQDQNLSVRLDANRDAIEMNPSNVIMTYEGIEYAIRAGSKTTLWATF